MAKTRIYTFPSGNLDWIGEASVRLVGQPGGLSLILESTERTISAELGTRDLKRLLLDLGAAISLHKAALDLLDGENQLLEASRTGTPWHPHTGSGLADCQIPLNTLC
jgi:hypothetical protein